MEQLSANKCFGGSVRRYQHTSEVLRGPMKFHVFLPPAALAGQKVPTLYYLSGLTCTDENAVIKSGIHEHAAKHGIAVVFPDTSPRAFRTAGDDAAWDFGQGAGFYVDATQAPWSEAYKMYSYVTRELPAFLEANLPLLPNVRSITGHSMGGHGALVAFLKNPGAYKSVSAFAPICNPSECPWGVKAFSGYLGAESKEAWLGYDATALVKKHSASTPEILIDQGVDDKFYKEKQLLPENFEAAARAAGVPVRLRMQEGYDHSYFFIASFVAEHVAHHAKHLKA